MAIAIKIIEILVCGKRGVAAGDVRAYAYHPQCRYLSSLL